MTSNVIRDTRISRDDRLVLVASSLGAVFEAYDFYLAGSLAVIISRHFFSGVNPGAAFVFTLLSFAAGFAVRPFGSIVFGRIGDKVGRKYTFLFTISVMGISTFLIGLLPGFDQIGIAAPILFIGLRLLQGLSLGGEYSGAATYVAEHAPNAKRGAWTAWIQTPATLSLLLSLVVIIAVRYSVGEAAFAAWGWRVPFLLSALLLAASVWIRLKLHESPVYSRMKAKGGASKAPLKEAFGQWRNLRLSLIALFGLVAGQAVVLYTGQFYALFFLTQTLKLDIMTANILIGVALIVCTPLFIVFGALSDRVGRKPVIMIGLLIAAFAYFPLFKGLTHYVNPALERALRRSPIELVANPAECSFQFNPTGTARFTSSCDIAKQALARAGLSYRNVKSDGLSPALIHIGDIIVPAYAATSPQAKTEQARFTAALTGALAEAGYPTRADPAQINWGMAILILITLGLLITATYGPVAAVLAEMFPTRIRYTAVSLPYNIGNGWFGGFLPATAFAIVAASGDIYAGLWYPVGIIAITFVVGVIWLPETRGTDLEIERALPPAEAGSESCNAAQFSAGE
ncbi:Sialic acid transporter NanT [Paraburkholderia gardini]|nr:MFS transporter [Paraburkholderia gardini]CAG4913993.1 Sialic acid transporter NanT [Paraburkholderia gardini]